MRRASDTSAERHSVRRATVRDVLRREGIDPAERPHRSKFTPELKVDLCERFAASATRRELAILYDVSESTVKSGYHERGQSRGARP